VGFPFWKKRSYCYHRLAVPVVPMKPPTDKRPRLQVVAPFIEKRYRSFSANRMRAVTRVDIRSGRRGGQRLVRRVGLAAYGIGAARLGTAENPLDRDLNVHSQLLPYRHLCRQRFLEQFRARFIVDVGVFRDRPSDLPYEYVELIKRTYRILTANDSHE
jgi:hypothetical protein